MDSCAFAGRNTNVLNLSGYIECSPLPITRWKAYNGVVNFVFLKSYLRKTGKDPWHAWKNILQNVSESHF